MAFLQAEPVRVEKHKDKDGNITRLFVAVVLHDDLETETKYKEYWITGPSLDEILAIPTTPGRKAALIAHLRPLIIQDHANFINQELPNRPQPKESLDAQGISDYLGIIT
jgi:hypothetical protein